MLDGLGLAQVDVLGISWGGMLAQELARCDAARVRRLVLVATPPAAPRFPGHPAPCSPWPTPVATTTPTT